jgi:putative pre-16S rRNA nuclease
MRCLGLDAGAKRIGLAISDATGTLARPLRVVSGFRSDAEAASMIATVLEELERTDQRVERLVIGLPAHLDGRPHERAAHTRALADALAARVQIPIVFEDERLSSREAESRLAVRVRDWRKRKSLIDAASAAVILQDHLDRQTTAPEVHQ